MKLNGWERQEEVLEVRDNVDSEMIGLCSERYEEVVRSNSGLKDDVDERVARLQGVHYQVD
ncbi:hypothetical protein THOM_0337 [Trachipleistophora hominis]|uniref:Uncharacterized protein n=1 Tax=Trachipleistophora hominis TaxID=72359 RepID=L7JZZ7_TRAHO|nr:hypothetical protein THOM_0337 [Trachipleistophora hominis]